MTRTAIIPDRNPVVLLHGIGDSSRVFNRLTPYLNERGWRTHGLDLVPNTGKAGLDELAAQVNRTATFSPVPALLVGLFAGSATIRKPVCSAGPP